MGWTVGGADSLVRKPEEEGVTRWRRVSDMKRLAAIFLTHQIVSKHLWTSTCCRWDAEYFPFSAVTHLSLIETTFSRMSSGERWNITGNMSMVKGKVKVLKVQTEIWPRRKKLLQVTTFCCCTIFHLLRDAVKSSGCFWADLLWVRWAAEQKETMKTSWSRRSAADEEEWWCRSWDRSEATDQTSAGHQQLDMEAEDSTLSWRTLRKRSEVSPLERKCWCGQFERCSRWRIQTSVRMELLSDWRLHSHLFPETVNTKPDTPAEK